MFIKRMSGFLLLLCLFLSASAWAGKGFFLKPGDRVVFLGDSITAQALYTKLVEDFVTAFRPELKVEFFNAGVGGDTTWGALSRLDKDVLAQNPTVVTICFGMNDAGYRPTVDSQRLDRYRKSLEELIARLKPVARVVLLTPPAVDEDRSEGLKGYNQTLAAFVQAVQEIGQKHRLRVVDTYHPMLEALKRGKVQDPAFTLIPDGVHPQEPGQLVMAIQILKAWRWKF